MQSNVHGLQETHTKLTRTHKTLALSELQQIVIDISFIYLETEKCTVVATHLANLTYQPPPLQLNISGYNMHVSASLKRKPDTMQTIH